MNKCNCGSDEESEWIYDARGIPLTKACSVCRDSKLDKYRPEVLDNPNYESDEDIDSDY